MPNPENLIGKGNRFTSTNQPKNRGRKPSIFKKWSKEYDISEKDIKDLMLNLTFAYTVGEVKELIKQAEENEKEGNVDKLPLGVAQFLAGSVRDIKRGDLKAWWSMLDRSYGKPAQSIEMSASGDMLFTALGPEERKKRIAELLKKAAAKKNDEPGKTKRR
jgi:hypothetical protein